MVDFIDTSIISDFFHQNVREKKSNESEKKDSGASRRVAPSSPEDV